MKRVTCIISFCFVVIFLKAQTITTVAGNGISGYSGDGGPAIAAELTNLPGVATDGAGNIYITDKYNACVRKVDNAGIITTVAGTGSAGYCGDGGAATAAELYCPWGITVDGAGNIYIAETAGARVRMVNTSGIITTIAGNGTSGYTGDGGAATAAEVENPSGVAVDGAGNVYIADGNAHRIRKINTSGIITTIAGNGTAGHSGDGGAATAAELNQPAALALDGFGNLFIADQLDNSIREINTSGVITTIAGNSTAGFSGDGGAATAAELYWPFGVAVDGVGNVYIGDYSNGRIRMVNTSGIITTIAGNGTSGYTGDGGAATAAELNYPAGVAVGATDNLYIADYYNSRIRGVSLPLGINEVTSSGQVNVYPVPSNGFITASLNGNGYTEVKILDVLGREVYSSHLEASEKNITLDVNICYVPGGIYFMQISTLKGIINKRIEVQK